jgi:hypothetical protein
MVSEGPLRWQMSPNCMQLCGVQGWHRAARHERPSEQVSGQATIAPKPSSRGPQCTSGSQAARIPSMQRFWTE